MSFSDDHMRNIAALVTAPETDRFTHLVRLAGINPATAFRFARLRGLDFRNEDLSGYDFSYADLTGTDFTGVDTTGIIGLDTAILDGVVSLRPPTDFSQEAVERMILSGQAPPTAWRPFITQLGFGGWSWDQNGSAILHSGNSTGLIDLDLLKNFRNMEKIGLSGLPNGGIDRLMHLSKLHSIYLTNVTNRDILGISKLTKLSTVYLWHTAVSDLTPMAGITELVTLDIFRSDILDLKPLARFGSRHVTAEVLVDTKEEAAVQAVVQFSSQLRSLSVAASSIADISGIEALGFLEELDLQDTLINNINPIANLHNLQTLRLDNTSIGDLTPLANLTNLRRLTLYYAHVPDLTPIAGIASLQFFGATDTEVGPDALQAFRTNRRLHNLPEIDIHIMGR